MLRVLFTEGKEVIVSLDCTKSFDCVGFDAASEALTTKGVPKGVTLWYTNLLKGRKVTVNLQGVTQTITPGRGSPQGRILSPLVWNLLVMDSLLKEFQSGPLKAVGYADDIMIMTQVALDKIMFNPNKTQTIIFDRSRKYKVSPPTTVMDGQELKFTDHIKYL